MNVHAAQLCHQPIGAAGRNLPQQQVVDAVLAPTAHNVVALFELLQKFGDFSRIMLKVAIHGDHIFTMCCAQIQQPVLRSARNCAVT